MIFEKNKSIEKLRKKIEKLRTKLIETDELKAGLDNRNTITEMKYFNMEKELSFKQTELKDAFVKHQKELEKKDLKQINLIKKKS